MRSLIDISDFSDKDIEEIVQLACKIADNPRAFATAAAGKTLATLFYEPSTRTRLSFESAMYGLGGHVLGFADGDTSSSSKGETMADTARVVSCYADVVVIRHPREGACAVAAQHATVPVINAGDGGHCHPTQTLTDLVTIFRERGRLDHLRIGLCGDLKYGRTVHSLIEAMSRRPGTEFVLISPDELALPDYVKQNVLVPRGVPFEETPNLTDALPSLDILYMTRIQSERFDDPAVYERLKGSYVLDAGKMSLAKGDMCVLHPLPRVGEISPEVDADPRACYFRQVQNGKFARMALIMTLLGSAQEVPEVRMANAANVANATEAEAAEAAEAAPTSLAVNPAKAHVSVPAGAHCENARCITAVERDLAPAFVRDPSATLRCAYCESEVCE